MAAEPDEQVWHSFDKPDSSSADGDFGTAVVFGVVATVIVMFFVYVKPSAQRVDATAFCCPDVLQQLFSAANFSVDPCYSIFSYTCYAFIASRDDAFELLNRAAGPLDGFPVTRAGKAVAAYYRACVLSAENDSVSLARSSADAVINVINPPRGSTLTPQALIQLIIELSLRFGLSSIVHLEVGALPDSTMCLNISIPTLRNSAASKYSPSLETMMRSALEAVNEAFSLKVQIQEVQAFLNELQKLKASPTERYAMNILADVTSAITESQWKELLAKFNVTSNTSIFSVPIPSLKGAFKNVIKPDKLQFTLVSTLVAASVKLASSVLLKANTSVARAQMCRLRAESLHSLFLLDRIENFMTPSQDAAIRGAYIIVVDALLRKAFSSMESDDFNKLRKTLGQMRVVLPSDLFPGDLAVPIMTSSYAHSELVSRAYVMQVQRHWTFVLGFSSDYARVFNENHVTITGNTILVPTLVYTIISLTKSAEPLVLMPTVGVYLADSLWQFVFRGNWSNSTDTALHSYLECIQKNSRSLIEWPSELLWLSVQTSYEASIGAQWNAVVDAGAGRRVTRAEIFYMTLVRYVFCQAPHSKYLTFGLDVDLFMSGFEDFYKSFRCKATVSKITGAVCSTHML
ncbi:hypothetical protein HPB50_010063 [Hyalomma asiaticum]|uniref:Uncharacterized protein n=1 Tax=Hyalomma asiaticum TaxID=266040 RepID=A0ACB7RZS2_HYAAI|nr:hypothetical protein HPB50_010063 [Hyalomma asiaticum]